MTVKRILAAIMGCILSAACTPAANTGDPASYAKSMTAMTSDMAADRKAELRDALVAITFDQADPAAGMWSQADAASPVFVSAGDKINGKTADQIIRLGYQTRIGLIDKAIAEDAAAIQRIKAERAKYAAVFDNIHIDGARYHVVNNGFMDDPTISFTITNGAKFPIKRVYLHGILTSPGRAIPWVSDDINYEFSGGLEPGENQALDLAPNMFGAWKIDDRYSRRPDLMLVLTVTNVEDAGGQQLLQGDPGDVAAKAADADKLQRLRAGLAAKLAKL
ncbi:hypothetical protein [uncultured Sphingomonas sp.]|uniref:hypothetical protein n=1 Tax=uncultured Sphingomonas sp. TaxID=158754 RepID=UPI0035CA66A6